MAASKAAITFHSPRAAATAARHPHLAHRLVEMLKTGNDAYPDAVASANITCTGILAHESAMKGGEIVRLPGSTHRS